LQGAGRFAGPASIHPLHSIIVTSTLFPASIPDRVGYCAFVLKLNKTMQPQKRVVYDSSDKCVYSSGCVIGIQSNERDDRRQLLVSTKWSK